MTTNPASEVENTATAYFERATDAWSAVLDLTEAGIPRDEISFIASKDAMSQIQASSGDPAQDQGNTGAGIAAGSVVGGAAATLLSLLAGVALPGVGAVMAFGPLFSAFAGSVAGSVAGGFIGARVNWQHADEEAQPYFEEGLRRGGALIFVHTTVIDAHHIDTLLKKHNGGDIRESAKRWQTEGWTPAASNAAADGEQMTADNASRSGKMPGVPSFSAIMPTYQEHFSKTFAGAGRSFDEYSAGYMYGYNLANDERYRDQEWEQIEGEIRADWQGRPHRNWPELSQIIRFARDKALGRV